ncbi:motility associated factor glycosyltransferase family protein [Spirochaetota bacterium]
MEDTIEIKQDYAKDKSPVITVYKENVPYALSSKYSPKKEAQRIIEEHKEKNADIILLIGMGNIELCRQILQEYKDAVKIFIEKEMRIIDLAAEHLFKGEERVQWGGAKAVYILHEDDYKEALKDIFAGNVSKKISIFVNRQEAVLFEEFTKNVHDEIIKTFDRKSINITTISRFEKLWFKNIIKNTRILFHSPGIKELFGMFTDIPCIIVCAGPSLNKNLDILKERSGSALVIASDTIYKTLLFHGIVPDIVVSVDPQKINARYLENISEEEKEGTFYIFEPAICNTTVRAYEGRVFFFDTIFPFYKIITKYTGEMGEINMGGSVATTIYDIALKLGCSPITFIGLDLSYSNDTYHVKGTMYEEMWFSGIDRFDTYEMKSFKLLDYFKLKKITDINGKEAYMDAKFTMFQRWFEDNIRKKAKGALIYNSTEGGAGIPEVENITLNDFIEAQMKKGKKIQNKKKLRSSLREIIDRMAKTKDIKAQYESFRAELAEIEKELASYTGLLEQAEELSLKINNKIKRKAKVEEKLLRELDRIDTELMQSIRVKDLINITIQRIIFLIKEGHEIDFDEEVDEKRKSIMTSLYLYREMLASAQLVKDGLKQILNEGIQT